MTNNVMWIVRLITIVSGVGVAVSIASATTVVVVTADIC